MKRGTRTGTSRRCALPAALAALLFLAPACGEPGFGTVIVRNDGLNSIIQVYMSPNAVDGPNLIPSPNPPINPGEQRTFECQTGLDVYGELRVGVSHGGSGGAIESESRGGNPSGHRQRGASGALHPSRNPSYW